jgi:putative NADPH-quinone reductase
VEPDLNSARDAMLAADSVIIFPLWLATLPAIFKGYLERVLWTD